MALLDEAVDEHVATVAVLRLQACTQPSQNVRAASDQNQRTFEPTEVTGHAPLLDEQLRDERLAEAAWRLRARLVRALHALAEQRVWQ